MRDRECRFRVHQDVAVHGKNFSEMSWIERCRSQRRRLVPLGFRAAKRYIPHADKAGSSRSRWRLWSEVRPVARTSPYSAGNRQPYRVFGWLSGVRTLV
jgi:hypothetical protein